MEFREERIQIRANAETKAILSRAAALQGRSLSTFLLESAMQNAREILQEQEMIVLSAHDWEEFVRIMDTARPRPRLAAAVKRYKEVVECR